HPSGAVGYGRDAHCALRDDASLLALEDRRGPLRLLAVDLTRETCDLIGSRYEARGPGAAVDLVRRILRSNGREIAARLAAGRWHASNVLRWRREIAAGQGDGRVTC